MIDRVSTSIPCMGCSYDLRGLSFADACPECGALVAISTHGELRDAPAQYICRLHRGLVLILDGLLLVCIVWVVSLVFWFEFVSTNHRLTLAMVIVECMMAAPLIAIMLGFWKYAAPDPRVFYTAPAQHARVLLRASTVVQGLLLLTILSITLTDPRIDGRFALLRLLYLATFCVQGVIALRYTAWVASRLPDPSARKRAWRYTWLLPLMTLGFPPLAPVAFLMYCFLLRRVCDRLASIHRETGQPVPAATHT